MVELGGIVLYKTITYIYLFIGYVIPKAIPLVLFGLVIILLVFYTK